MIMKRFFQIFAIAALALGFTACEQGEATDNGEITLSLTADKNEIVADGVDKVTFTVLVNDKANSEAQIICLKDNSFVENNTFTTTEAGEYLFKAIYKNKSSDPFKVTATAVAENPENPGTPEDPENPETPEDPENPEVPSQKVLRLKASKIRIKADGEDKVVFTALYGNDDVTASCTIKSTNGIVAENGEFSTTTPGTYDFYAYYEELTQSNSVSIDAYDPAIAEQYQVGAVCEVNGSKGVIYAIKNNKAYVVSLDEAFLQWSTENVWCNCMSENGSFNTSDPFDPTYCRADGGVRDINNYPAFKWCKEHGADWFLPSSTELQWLWDVTSGGKHEYNCEEMKAFNKILTDNGGTAIGEDYYWSSNETSAELIEFVAFMHNSVICADPQKTSKMLTRAITCFNISVD